MCNSEILHFEKAGYVIRCSDCQHFHVAFGNISMDQSQEAFDQFKNIITVHYQKHVNHRPLDSRDIWVASPCRGLRFLFSVNELRQLHEILQKAHLILMAEKIAFNE